MATHDTKKMTAGRSFAELDKADQSKYSSEYLRSHLSTGGGEPIPKGEKLTTQRRVLQPRDPDTGQFGWNADAGFDRLYMRGAKRAKGVPLSVRKLNIRDNIMKGDVINIGGRTFVAPRDMTKAELVDYFKTAVTGEYAPGFSGRDERDFAKNRSYGRGFKNGDANFARVVRDVNTKELKYEFLNDVVDKKKGRISNFEKEAVKTTPAPFNISESRRTTAQA